MPTLVIVNVYLYKGCRLNEGLNYKRSATRCHHFRIFVKKIDNNNSSDVIERLVTLAHGIAKFCLSYSRLLASEKLFNIIIRLKLHASTILLSVIN